MSRINRVSALLLLTSLALFFAKLSVIKPLGFHDGP